MRFPRPCLVCNNLHRDPGDYCTRCRAEREKKRESDPRRKAYKNRLYNSEYQRVAKLIRQHAITCHLCGEGYRPNDPWTADHVNPGQLDSVLLPAHRSCNIRKGNRPE